MTEEQINQMIAEGWVRSEDGWWSKDRHSIHESLLDQSAPEVTVTSYPAVFDTVTNEVSWDMNRSTVKVYNQSP